MGKKKNGGLKNEADKYSNIALSSSYVAYFFSFRKNIKKQGKESPGGNK